MGQKPVLGKGLASLLPNAAILSNTAETIAASGATPVPQQELGNRDRHPGISFALVDEIITNHYQPRRDFDVETLKELAQSIRTNGIIQPLIVRKGFPNGYQLIAGERRLRAAKLAGLKQVPIVIRKSTDREVLELALIENIQRENLNCIDEALAYQQLLQDFSLTQEEIAERVGKERATVANFLRLLKLPQSIIEDLKNGLISFGHGKALLGLEDRNQCIQTRNQILKQKLSVRATEVLVESLKQQSAQLVEMQNNPENNKTPQTSLQVRFETLSQDLTRHWSTRVELRGTERCGKIIIHYSSRQELERMLNAMNKKELWENQLT